MKKVLFFASMLLLPLCTFALDAPTSFTANLDMAAGVLYTDWEDVAGAVKYSVDVVVEYDTDGDGEADMSVDFSFGTSDRDDGGEMGDSDLEIPFDVTALIGVDVNGDTVSDTLIDALARVKALNPGKGNGSQNNPFSAFAVFYPAP